MRRPSLLTSRSPSLNVPLCVLQPEYPNPRNTTGISTSNTHPTTTASVMRAAEDTEKRERERWGEREITGICRWLTRARAAPASPASPSGGDGGGGGGGGGLPLAARREGEMAGGGGGGDAKWRRVEHHGLASLASTSLLLLFLLWVFLTLFFFSN